MSLNHDFLLLDRKTDGEWALCRFIHDPRAMHLHDDFVRYIGDTLDWIPTINPSKKQPHRGLCMWGVACIEAEWSEIAGLIFNSWAELFSHGPKHLTLSGSFSWAAADDAAPPSGESASQLEGGYDSLEYDRDEVVGVLRQLAAWCGVVGSGSGQYYVLHKGV